MTWLIVLQTLLSFGSCTASVFGYEGDAMAGGDAICVHRPLKEAEVGVAHRTLACGSRVILVSPRTKRWVVARVVDRGPYGAVWRGRWRLKRRETDRGEWRGCLDLTKAAARKLGHRGFEEVWYAPVVQWQSAGTTSR